MHFATLSVTLLSLLLAVCSSRADEGCDDSIKNYLECYSEVKEVADEVVKKLDTFDDNLDACFTSNDCKVEDKEEQEEKKVIDSIPEKCMNDLVASANSLMKNCWEKHYPHVAVILENVSISSDVVQDSMITFDQLLDMYNEDLYKDAAIDAFYALYLLKNNSVCSAEQQEQVNKCLVDLFETVAVKHKTTNMFLRLLDSEKRFNSFCKDHKACYDKMPPVCVKQLNDDQAGYCKCLDENSEALVSEFSKCSGFSQVTLTGPKICEETAGAMFCRNSFMDALIDLQPVVDDEDQPEPTTRRKRDLLRKSKKGIAIRIGHR
ncbi:unnamed protein product [Soboliphyme baturini]|uniref:Secreted protein n=1 Tax=Soboliphyme baturini TaxID=241478 RepID=A0A183IY71_9BILA|nr:unnamed protein product [Soboliphyme baturini]